MAVRPFPHRATRPELRAAVGAVLPRVAIGEVGPAAQLLSPAGPTPHVPPVGGYPRARREEHSDGT